jgi:biopolymer transport protein ExbB
MNYDTISEIAATSGGIIYIMGLLLLVALTVIIERLFFLGRLLRQGDSIAASVNAMTYLDRAKLETLRKANDKYPQAGLLGVVLKHPEIRDTDHLDSLLEEEVLRQVPKLDKSLWVLDTIVTLAPLLGLFGTIVGMFHTFSALSGSDPATGQVSGGIAEALVATAAGLLIAIVGLVFFNGLNNRVRLVIHQLETIKRMLLNRLPAAQPLGTDIRSSRMRSSVGEV